MRRIVTVSIGTFLLCGAWLVGWSSAPAAALAAEPAGPETTQAPEAGPVGFDLFPPLPFSKATMDVPRIRLELEALLAAADQEEAEEENGVNSSIDDRSPLHLDVNEARTGGEKWIEVNLSDQTLYAWAGDELQREFLISSGTSTYPTVQGVFRMWVRTPTQTMSGGSKPAGTYYSLPNVQWVQYFYGEYALHGAYWHNNFGTPMSHGCVNLAEEDAEWLFKWSFPEWDGSTKWVQATVDNATLVWVHN